MFSLKFKKNNMGTMSKTFDRAYGARFYDYNTAITLYNQEIEKFNPENFAAWHNRGVCKIHKAILEQDLELAIDGKVDIMNAIDLAKDDYPMADDNIKWADDIILKLKSKL